MCGLLKSKYKQFQSDASSLSLQRGSVGEYYLQQQYDTSQRSLGFYNKQMLKYLYPVIVAFSVLQEILFTAIADKHGDCKSSISYGGRFL
jgi:hypothetical protein